MEVVALGLMAALAALSFVLAERDRRDWRTERQTLLDRIQAPTFHELKAYAQPRQATSVYLSDEDEARIAAGWAAERAEADGIAI